MTKNTHRNLVVGLRLGPLALLIATMSMACVDLRKPAVVEECAAAGNCSDDPNAQTKRDAHEDLPGPDSFHGNEPTAQPDAAPDTPSGDTRDVSSTESRESGEEAVRDLAPPPAEVEPDLGPDLVRQDGRGDLGPDVPADQRPDVGPDLQPDLGPDSPPDLPPDLGRDLSPDLGRDLLPDVPPDVPPDTSTLVSGLRAYYKCESATGTTLPDSSGNNNNGTLSASGYSFPTGKVGKALALAKASQGYVSLPTALFANATDITVAAWVNVTTSQSWQRVFDVGIDAKLANNTSTGTLYLNLVPRNGGTNSAFSITKDGYGSEQTLTSAELAAATWKHVAVVLGSGSGGLYIDGSLAADGSAISLRPKDLGAINYAYLGKSQFSADPYFDGLLDEVRIYNRALSAAEIKSLYQFTGP